MSGVSWGAFDAPVDAFDHRAVQDKLMGLMETGYHGAARDHLNEYAKDFPDKAESLRLSLVRLYGTGL